MSYGRGKPVHNQQIKTKTHDPDLLSLVEEYLARNRDQSFVNIEDMVNSLQNKSYRFSRTKKNVFTQLVQKAYYRYVEMNKPSERVSVDHDEYIGPGMNNSQSNDSMQFDSELDKVSSDSDIEIVEEQEPKVEVAPTITPMIPMKKIEATITAVPITQHSATDHNHKQQQQRVEVIKCGVKRKLDSVTETDKNRTPNTVIKQNGFKKQKKELPVIQNCGINFSDFGGGEKVIEEICQLLLHLKHPEIYKNLGVPAPRGFLLHGPPGCGKTLLASAIAGESKLPMLKMAATELISGISGESEGNIRDLFRQAVDLAPCIIFLDEIDAITPRRETAQREMERRIVAQLIACIDELGTKEKGDLVLLVGATNRIETIDSALRRAGRFDREISLGIPDEAAREKILKVICRTLRLESNFDFSLLSKLTPGYVGADLQALAREAAILAINEILSPEPVAPDVATTSNNNNIAVGVITSNKKVEDVETKTVVTPDAEEVMETTDSVISINEESSLQNCKDDTPVTETATVTDSENKGQTDSTEESAPAQEEKKDEHEVITIDEKEKEIEKPTSSMEADVVDIADDDSDGLYDNIFQKSTPSISSSETTITIKENDIGCIVGQPTSKWIHRVNPLSKQQLDKIFIKLRHFELALKHVQPSAKREGFATVPDTTWDDIGALKEIRDELQVSILGPVKYSAAFTALAINNPAGVLLCGPPGCGKTLLAKAVANEAGINFISVKGPELLNMYVGESERAVRQCFLRAKNSSPCVIFFDELDALCPRRSDGNDGNSTSRVVNQLLTEMDGMESRQGVFIMAATNRPDIIDPAILRPGRLDKILFVNLPTTEDRMDILQTITKKGTRPKLDDDVILDEIVKDKACENYTGADLAALVREASIAAFRELVLQPNLNNLVGLPTTDLKVSKRHFETAMHKIKPSVSKKDLEKYSAMKDKYSQLSG